jgi:PAS domain S-box-containing protein
MVDDRLKTSRGGWKAAWLGFAQAGAVAALAALTDRFLLPLPSPFPLLLLVVVYASYRGGMCQGLPCVAVVFVCALIHQAKPGEFFHYDPEGGMGLLMSGGVPLSIVAMMELLRRRAEQAGRESRDRAVLEAQFDERAKAEAALRGWQTEQQILFDSVPAMIWFKDKENGRILRANRPAAESIGRTVAEVEGHLTEELYPGQAAKYQGDDLEVIESGRPKLGIIERYEIPTGEDRWVRTDKIPYRDEAGNILGVIVFAVDVSEQKRAEESLQRARDELQERVRERTEELEKANEHLRHEIAERQRGEEALRASEARCRAIGETIAAAAFIFQGAKLVDVNPAASQITGYTREELVGQDFWKIIHPDHRERVAERGIARQRGENVPLSYEVKILRKDGGVRWVDFTAGMIEINGQPAVLGTADDITDRKQAQEALRESEQRLQAILDYTTAVIYVKDLDGRYILINRRFEELFHIPKESIIGRSDHDVFPREAADAFRANDRRVLEAGIAMELEENVPHDDGIHTYISVKFPIGDASGRIRALCGISTDITERKRDEAELRKAKDAAEEASRAKSRFLANISHEIRTPIMAMLGAAELVRSGDGEPTRLRDRGDVILRNGRHLLALIDDLLDQSRLEAGRLDVLPAECSLVEIMADVHAVTSPLRQQRSVDFEINYETAVPEWIVTDRTRLTQAIVNIVHNALKFTRCGYVRVRVCGEQSEAAATLTVVVEDSGAGIAESDLERIFERFTQVGPVWVGASAGVGLGLPLAKWIVERLGGRLEVASEIGFGSRFTLRVPVGPVRSTVWMNPDEAARRSRSPRADDASQTPSLGGHVLLAEDAEDVRRVMTEALERAGAEVVGVADGRAAVEAVRDRAFDLILLDIRMPVMDGLEAARQLRRDGCRSTLIALTASTTRSEHEQILAAGFDDLWPKPISLERLVREAAAFLHAPDSVPSAGRSEAKPPIGSACEAGNDHLAVATAGFARSLPSRMSRLHAAIASGDFQEAREILHQLMGSAGMYGFMEVSQQAALVSAEVKKGEISFDSAAYRLLKELVDAIVLSVAASPAAVDDRHS